MNVGTGHEIARFDIGGKNALVVSEPLAAGAPRPNRHSLPERRGVRVFAAYGLPFSALETTSICYSRCDPLSHSQLTLQDYDIGQ